MKSILLVMPKYYGYELYIKEEIQKRGYKVYLLYENLAAIDTVYRVISNYLKKYEDKYIYRYYKNYIDGIHDTIEKVVVIRGSSIRKNILCLIDEKFPRCHKVMYQWDSVKNNKNVLEIYGEFDRVLTFDMEDAKKFGWLYRPLFYIDELCSKTQKRYDFTFICTLHSQRVEIAKSLLEIADKMQYKKFLHIYTTLPSHIRHKYLLKDPAFVNSEKIKIKHYSLSLEETNDIYDKSKIIVDYTHPDQKGFTMRTIESIGHKCKLITNNRNILEADFYNQENVLLYDGYEIEIPAEFVSKPYAEIADHTHQKYSLTAFVDDLLSDDSK